MRLDNSYTDKAVDRETKALEKKMAKEYRQAWKELTEKTDAYFESFAERDEAYYNGLMDGTITPPAGKTPEQHYQEWRVAQIGRGKRWETLRDQMAERMVEANKVSTAYINDTTPTIASLSHNYSCYQIEKATGLSDGISGGGSFSLVHEQAIKNLAKGAKQYEFKVSDKDGFYTFRRNEVDEQKDYNWNSKRIESALMQGLLQGDDMKHLSNRFYSVMQSNYKAAVRNARTSVTSAHNAGQLQALHEASEMGIEILVEWIATSDDRTRDSHSELDGVRIKEGETFPNGLRYPADPQGAPEEVYNCRCSTAGVIPKINDSYRVTGKTVDTYQEWLEKKLSEKIEV